MAELVGGVGPVRAEGEVVHGERRVSRRVSLHPQEGWQGGHQLVVRQGGERLEENKSLAAGVARRPVDVQLVLLVLVQERPPSLEHRQVVVVPVREQVRVVPLRDRLLHLDRLAL